MAEQSLRERLHPSASASAAENRGAKLKLLMGFVVGLAAAAFFAKSHGYFWAAPGLLIAGACAWGFLARMRHHH
jgi:hypothetical protein